MSPLRVTSLLISGLILVVACSRRQDNTCTVDVDCGNGSACFKGVCAQLDPNDGGADSSVQVACTAAGGSCTVDDDCCVRPCNGFRCAGTGGTSGRSSSSGASGTSGTSGTSSSSGTTSSGGGCQDLFGLCSSDPDCCTGLMCDTSGTCR